MDITTTQLQTKINQAYLRMRVNPKFSVISDAMLMDMCKTYYDLEVEHGLITISNEKNIFGLDGRISDADKVSVVTVTTDKIHKVKDLNGYEIEKL